jgi:hypothetical protein
MPFGVNAPGTAKKDTGNWWDHVKTGAAIVGGTAAIPAAIIAAPIAAATAGAFAASPGIAGLGAAGATGLGAAAKFVKGFGSKTIAASNAAKGVGVVTTRTAGTVARVPKRIGPGPSQALVTIPRVAPRINAVGRPAPGIGNAAKIGVAAGVVAGTSAAYGIGINDAYRSGTKPTATPTSKPTTVAPKQKNLAYFMAEAKKKGKTGKGASNYAYTMFKDSKMRTGTSGYTGVRISGMNPEK